MSPPGPRDFKPRQAGNINWAALKITPEEGFLLSRIDGSTSLTNLGHLTNLKPEQVRQAVSRLVRQGLVENSGVPAEVMSSSVRWTEPTPVAEPPPPPRPAPEAVEEDVFASRPPDAEEPLETAFPLTPVPPEELTIPDGLRPPELAAQGEASEPPPPEADGPPPTDEPPPAEEPPPAAEEAAAPPAEGEPEATPEQAALTAEEGNYRKLFETELHPLAIDVRQARAQQATGPELLAFCYDPDPGVIRNVLENALSGFEHARLIASAHHTGMGLDHLTRRPELFRDSVVQRRLLSNLQLPEPMFKRIAGSKRLADLFKLTTDRDVADKVRGWSRNFLRYRFSTAAAEERVEFIFHTEGRPLVLLNGITFDSQTTAMMCRRQYHSTLLIQNLARFPGTTPQIILHLLRQPVVKRQQHLRTMLLQHPNTPSDAKHRVS